MTTPAFEKTWAHTETYCIGSTDMATQYRTLMWNIKNILVGMGWQPRQSTNSNTLSPLYPAVGNYDLWVSQASLTYISDTPIWIVLQTPAEVLTPWYICLAVTNFPYNGYIRVSNIPFAAGARGTLPISSTYTSLISGGSHVFGLQDASMPYVFHGLQSTDKLHTRIIGMVGGKAQFIMFCEEMADARGAENANVIGWSSNYTTSTPSDGNVSSTRLFLASTAAVNSQPAVSAIPCGSASFTAECAGTAAPVTTLGNNVRTDIDGNDLMLPVGVWCSSGYHFGRRGRMKDLYWTNTHQVNGKQYPSSTGVARSWIKLGELVFPCPDLANWRLY